MTDQLNYEKICQLLTDIYSELQDSQGGKVADYIPELAEVNPDLFGISYCDLEGRIFQLGDTTNEFCIQSCCKPLNYCLARQINNNIDIHEFVGYEPSGQEFNSFIMNKQGKPHNPMINSGAIMISSLLHFDREPSEKFKNIIDFYSKMAGNIDKIGFNNTVFLSEKRHADRNISLAYLMRENKAYRNHTSPNDIAEILDIYFQCCSVSINANIASVISATLANNGICPLSNEKIISQDIVKDCLSLMYACGMYDFSGQFAFKIGLPAKSGVSGCLFLVIPNLGGICIWSPPLDVNGNSVKGVKFCELFAEKTNNQYHIFSHVTKQSKNEIVSIQKIINLVANNKLENLKEIMDLNPDFDLNQSDYDKRTPLHLAAAEGNYEIVDYLINKKVNPNPKDRWGNTPYHEANKIYQKTDSLNYKI